MDGLVAPFLFPDALKTVDGINIDQKRFKLPKYIAKQCSVHGTFGHYF
jgi:hypothetical protein